MDDECFPAQNLSGPVFVLIRIGGAIAWKQSDNEILRQVKTHSLTIVGLENWWVAGEGVESAVKVTRRQQKGVRGY